MTKNNKPEWFEIAENDGPASPPKASKTLPLAAVFVTALILGVGAVVAQVQEKSPVTTVETASAQITATSNTPSPTSLAQDPQSSPVARVSNPVANSSIAATSGLQNPAIAQLPTSGDDDDEGEDDDDDDEDEDDDEDDEDD
jgi:hypothetical protein